MAATASTPASPQPAKGSPIAAPQPKEIEDATAQEGRPDADIASPTSRSESADKEEGEVDGEDEEQIASAPPLPSEPVPGSSGPPLPPNEAVPQADDGWDCLWDLNTQAWFFYNRFTGKTQWDNPRTSNPSTADSAVAPSNTPAPAPAPLAPASSSSISTAAVANGAAPPSNDAIVGGYNPAIHGDYDPNAWYAQKYTQPDTSYVAPEIPSMEDEPYVATAGFNRFTGHFQQFDAGPGRHTDEAKSKRQMNSFFDVDAAATADDGRSLKAERSNQRISKSELKAFKEKRRAKKEEKRRAWLRD
ncbi:hypothetical protein EsDP_00005047 [Epichloe bromicola]|uniref:WW domain-containing protein n=1 Tax=Epichloe bromicola TaxID=79588 RepID=A0ABQ0CTI0_9HYPO